MLDVKSLEDRSEQKESRSNSLHRETQRSQYKTNQQALGYTYILFKSLDLMENKRMIQKN